MTDAGLVPLEWRLEELARINETLTDAERKAALCMLLDQETQLLSAIDRHKVEAQGENKQRTIQSFLEKVNAAWLLFDSFDLDGTLFRQTSSR